MEFYKMAGSGNDFVVIDNREGVVGERKESAVKLCHRKFGVGADGLVLVERSDKADFRMRFFNPDGSEAEMCGNGLRCIVRFFAENIRNGKAFTVETESGVLEGLVESDNTVKVQLNIKKGAELGVKITLQGVVFEVHSINTGVPHAVIVSDDIENIDIEKTGSGIRYHEFFSPKGTNVNWIKVVDEKTLMIRTYERGVEAETLSCGTGSVAAAIISSLLGKTSSPVTVIARSGEKLCVSFDESLEKVYLAGRTLLAFRGEWIGR